MNSFFTDNFYISKISTCLFVPKGSGDRIHKDRPFHGLVYNLEGIKSYQFDSGKPYYVEENQLFYLPKFSSYEVGTHISGGCIAVNFDLIDQSVTYPYFSLDAKYGEYHIDNFKKLVKIWNAKPNGYMNQCFKILYEIICNVQSEALSAYSSPPKRTMAIQGAELIMKRLSDASLTVDAISASLQISPEYFRKIFKDYYGVSPKKYLISKRIALAKELIEANEFQLQRIAELCGFRDAAYFSTEFKRITSVTPSEYLTPQN